MNDLINAFFDTVNKFLPYVSLILILGSVLFFLVYFFKKIAIRELKKRYDFISKFEIKVLWFFSLGMIIGIGIYPWQFVSETLALQHLVDLFIKFSLGLIVSFVIFYTLKYYYPTFLNGQLKRLRYRTRMSPHTGKPMKLLTEEEEDVYLDEGMQAEEDVYSFDYDVWIDEETGYTQIEKYSGKNTGKECPQCGYQTLKVEKEELLIAPTGFSSGELLKRLKCIYCGHYEKEIYRVAKLREEK